MDRRCVYYRKPLLESGTLGTKGNTQVKNYNRTIIFFRITTHDQYRSLQCIVCTCVKYAGVCKKKHSLHRRRWYVSLRYYYPLRKRIFTRDTILAASSEYNVSMINIGADIIVKWMMISLAPPMDQNRTIMTCHDTILNNIASLIIYSTASSWLKRKITLWLLSNFISRNMKAFYQKTSDVNITCNNDL